MAERTPPAVTYNRIIRYKGVPVLLDGAFTFKCGLEPDVNSFTVAHDDFAKLLPTAGDPGDLEFFFTRDRAGADGGADFKISKMVMVGWSPGRLGTTSTNPPTIGPIKWRIQLADFRERFVSPRGGRLTDQGVINAKNSKTQLKMRQLIQRCLDAMGMSRTQIDSGVDAVAAPQDLKWFGTHAPGQLDELLDRAGAVFVPKRDGTAVIDMIGFGGEPSAPQGRELPAVPLAGQDRRGRTVVFTSFPEAIVERMNVGGISDAGWQYVCPDPEDNGRWKKLADIPLLGGRPIELYRKEFKDLPQRWRSHFEHYLFKCIRLDPETYGQTPILRLARKWHEESGVGIVDDIDIRVLAKRFIPIFETRQYQNPIERVEVHANVLSYGAILRFDQVLMKFESDRAYSPDGMRSYLVPLASGDLIVQFGREERDPRTKAMRYFVVGFTREAAGAMKPLDDDEARAIAANPGRDDVVIERPDWIVYKENNEYVNLGWLRDKAKKEAARLLKGSGQPAELRSAAGWFPLDLSGKVAEIRLTQKPLKTEWRVNTWWLPGDYYQTQIKAKAKAKEAGNAHPAQQATQGDRQVLGAAGEVQGDVVLNPSATPLPAAPGGALMVKPGTKLDGGIYRGVVAVGRMSVTYEPGKPLGKINGTSQDCLIVNTLEQDRRTNRVLLGRWYAGAVELEPQADGTRTLAISVDPDVIKDLRYKAPVAPETKGHVQVAFETAPGHDSDWTDKIETNPCPEGA